MTTHRLSILAPVLLLVAAAPLVAQEQSFHACYVPDVGAIYLIGLEGLPTECLAAEHVEISWREGQAGITDHGELDGLGDDDHPEYVREGESAAGDLAGSFPAPMVAALRGHALAETEPADGQVLVWNESDGVWESRAPAEGVTDHGELAGLGDDDHPEYVREGEDAGGDLDGTFPEPQVVALQGTAVASTAPSGGEVLTWNTASSEWEPAPPSPKLTETEVAAMVEGTDHGVFSGLSDDDHPEYVREGEAAAGDLAGTFPEPEVVALRGSPLAETAPTDGQVLTWNEAEGAWQPVPAVGGITDHGELAGLGDDDHPEYVREGERAGGDLGGTFPEPSVASLQGNPVASATPMDGQVLTWDGANSAWEPAAARSGLTESEVAAIIAETDHGVLSGLAEDDHTQYLLADGTRNTRSGFAVTGSGSTGSIPVEGAGTRLMWYPRKTAFRAGAVNGSEWDDRNVGFYSIALGLNVTASGVFTTAIGVGATADAPNSGAVALGGNVSATADGALAMGLGTEASGVGSTALGVATVASTPYATAMGQETQASGTNATAMGRSTVAEGRLSTAFGDETTASGTGSTALGGGTTASGRYATAMGQSTTASADFSVAMGRGTVADVPGTVAIGQYNIATGGDSSFGSEVLIGGNGTSDADRSAAFAFFDTGNVWLAGTLTERSDRRLKLGIEPLGPALDAVRDLQPVRFRLRDGTGHPTEPQIGLIAQDVAEAFPELVGTDSEGYLGLAYPKLTAVLVRAMQEQQEQIEAQRDRLDALTARLERLEAAVEAREQDSRP